MTQSDGLEFDNLTRATLSSQVAEMIMGRIDNDQIEEGTKLPSERALGDAFGVSRVSIREAIQLLQAKGYVEILPGKGTYILSKDVRKAGSLQAWVGGREEELLMMVELRLIVEPGIAALAAKKVTPEAAATLLETAERLSTCACADISEVDASFHRQIAYMTKNSLIAELLGASLKTTERLRDRTLQDGQRRELAAHGHLKIAKAIAKGDATAAHAAMVQHLNDAEASL